MPSRLRGFVLLLLLVGLGGCKPSVEGESREWAANKQAAAEFETRWPGFAPALKASRAEADKLMKAADEVNSDEARAEAMDAANKVLAPLVGKLRSVSNKLDELDRAARRLDRLRVGPKDERTVRDVQDGATRVHGEVGKAMNEAAPATEAEALRFLDEQIARLDGSIRACKDTFERLSEPDSKQAPTKK